MICPIALSALSTVLSGIPAPPLLTTSIALPRPDPEKAPARTAPLLASWRSWVNDASARLKGPPGFAGGTAAGITTTAMVAWPDSVALPLPFAELSWRKFSLPNPFASSSPSPSPSRKKKH